MTFDDDVDTIVELIKKATIKKFGQEIDLIAIYGSRARGTHEPSSDLEMFAVVEKRERTNVEWFFLYKDIPVDLWTKEWEGIEKVSNHDPTAGGGSVLGAGTISTCKVIYYKDKESKNRFEKCRDKVRNLSANKVTNLDFANKIFDDMYKFLGKIYFAKEKQDFVEVRNNAWQIFISIAIILAEVNNRFYVNNWGTNIHEAKEFAIFPENLISDLEKLTSEDDYETLLLIASRVIDNIRTILIEMNEMSPIEVDLEFLCSEVSSIEFLNKIRKAVRHEDIIAASYAVHALQAAAARDLWINKKKWTKAGQFLLYSEYKEKYDSYGFPDFTDAITSHNFDELIKLADNFEEILLRYLNENDMSMNDFNDLDELKTYLNLA